jgi:hypothetical protein
MPDVTIIGSGANVRACHEVLGRAGIEVSHSFELDQERCPIILGELSGGFALARQAIESGRHVLLANPSVLSLDRLSLLLANRRRAQALFIWNEHRYHPGYRFLGGLIAADATWRPRFIRHESLSSESANANLMRWRTLEGVVLAGSLCAAPPLQVCARAATNAPRNAADFVSLGIDMEDGEAFLQVGLGEPVERRETTFATDGRKAYVDELNQTVPVRIVDEERGSRTQNSARWVSCPAPAPNELVRQQCLAFLEATLQANLTQTEADLWRRSLMVTAAAEVSLQSNGATIEVDAPPEEPRFRLVGGRSFAAIPPSLPA